MTYDPYATEMLKQSHICVYHCNNVSVKNSGQIFNISCKSKLILHTLRKRLRTHKVMQVCIIPYYIVSHFINDFHIKSIDFISKQCKRCLQPGLFMRLTQKFDKLAIFREL